MYAAVLLTLASAFAASETVSEEAVPALQLMLDLRGQMDESFQLDSGFPETSIVPPAGGDRWSRLISVCNKAGVSVLPLREKQSAEIPPIFGASKAPLAQNNDVLLVLRRVERDKDIDSRVYLHFEAIAVGKLVVGWYNPNLKLRLARSGIRDLKSNAEPGWIPTKIGSRRWLVSLQLDLVPKGAVEVDYAHFVFYFQPKGRESSEANFKFGRIKF